MQCSAWAVLWRGLVIVDRITECTLCVVDDGQNAGYRAASEAGGLSVLIGPAPGIDPQAMLPNKAGQLHLAVLASTDFVERGARFRSTRDRRCSSVGESVEYGDSVAGATSGLPSRWTSASAGRAHAEGWVRFPLRT